MYRLSYIWSYDAKRHKRPLIPLLLLIQITVDHIILLNIKSNINVLFVVIFALIAQDRKFIESPHKKCWSNTAFAMRTITFDADFPEHHLFARTHLLWWLPDFGHMRSIQTKSTAEWPWIACCLGNYRTVECSRPFIIRLVKWRLLRYFICLEPNLRGTVASVVDKYGSRENVVHMDLWYFFQLPIILTRSWHSLCQQCPRWIKATSALFYCRKTTDGKSANIWQSLGRNLMLHLLCHRIEALLRKIRPLYFHNIQSNIIARAGIGQLCEWKTDLPNMKKRYTDPFPWIESSQRVSVK